MLRKEVLCIDALIHKLKEVKRDETDNFSECQNNPHGLFDKVYLKTFFAGHKGTCHYFQHLGTSGKWNSVSRNSPWST